MSRLIREPIDVDDAMLNLLEHKCNVICGELNRQIYWWPLREACVFAVGQRVYELVRQAEHEYEVTIRSIITEYQLGGESNSLFLLERGTGLIQNILDTPIRGLGEGIVVRVCDKPRFTSNDNDNDNDLVSRILRDMDLRQAGGNVVETQPQ